MNKIIAYTDGSATVKYPYLGGFGVYIKGKQSTVKIRKGFSCTKTGRMELTAVIYCLKSIINKNERVVIYSDSQYVCNTCNIWIDNWERKVWVGLKNVDLLKELLFELRKFRIRPKLIHIKGHQEVVDEHTHGNSIADELANYKTQKNYQVDQLPNDLSNIELEDFETINGKMFYKNELFR